MDQDQHIQMHLYQLSPLKPVPNTHKQQRQLVTMPNEYRIILVTCVVAFALLLNGCAGFLAGAATGAAVSHDTRSTGTMLEDETIEVTAKEKLYKDNTLEKKIHINVTSYNHIVLLTGEVLSKELLDHAIDIVRHVDKVRRIHNELAISDLSSFQQRSTDTWITTKVKTKMLGEKNFDSTRIKVVTERGSVYLMGIVTSEQADKAAEIARNVEDVKRVVKLFEYITTPA